jgi:hypothetical protein
MPGKPTQESVAPYDVQQTLDSLQSNQSLDVTIRKKNKQKYPNYTMIGSGVATKDFPEHLVIDTLALVGSLNTSQLKIFLFFRDKIVEANQQRFFAGNKITPAGLNPNEVILDRSKHDLVAVSIRKLMRDNDNKNFLIDNMILKQKATNLFMVNPFLLIPKDHFSSIAEQWASYDQTHTTPELDTQIHTVT